MRWKLHLYTKNAHSHAHNEPHIQRAYFLGVWFRLMNLWHHSSKLSSCSMAVLYFSQSSRAMCNGFIFIYSFFWNHWKCDNKMWWTAFAEDGNLVCYNFNGSLNVPHSELNSSGSSSTNSHPQFSRFEMVKFRNGLDSAAFNAFPSLSPAHFFLLSVVFPSLFTLILLGLLNSIQLIYLYLSICALVVLLMLLLLLVCAAFLGEKFRVPFIFEAVATL